MRVNDSRKEVLLPRYLATFSVPRVL